MILTGLRDALTRERGTTETSTGPWNPPSWLAWGAIAVAVAVWTLVVWGTDAPVFPNDDISGLVYGAHIVNPSYHWELLGSSYLPGQSVLYAPLWAVSNDPVFIARGASIVVGMVGVLTLLPLTRLAQALGLTRNAGMIVAAITMIAPGRALYANYYWGETLLALGVAVLALTGLRLSRDPSVRNVVLFALAAGLTMSAHGRAFVIVGVAGLAILALAKTRVRVATVGAAVYALSIGGVLLLYRFTSQVNVNDARTERSVANLSDGGVEELAIATTSQIWYQIISWWALVLLGVALLIRWARSAENRVFARWSLAAFAMVLVFVVLLLSKPRERGLRIDGYAYGRYSEGFTYLLGFLGLVAIVIGVTRLEGMIVAGVAVIVGVLYLLLVVPNIPAGGLFVPGHMPGLFLLLDDDIVTQDKTDPWTTIVLISILFGVAGAMSARFMRVSLVLMAAYFLVYTVYADAGFLRTNPFFGDQARLIPSQVIGIGNLPDGVPLAVNSSLQNLQFHTNYYAFWLYPNEFVIYDPLTEERPSPLVLARTDWQEAADAGALPLNGSAFTYTVTSPTDDDPGESETAWVWVFPGEVQDAMDAQGLLAHPVSG